MQKNYRFYLSNFFRLSDLISIIVSIFIVDILYKQGIPNLNITLFLGLGLWLFLSTILESYKLEKYSSKNRRILGLVLLVLLQFGVMLSINDLLRSFTTPYYLLSIHLAIVFFSLVLREGTILLYSKYIIKINKNRRLSVVVVHNGEINSDVVEGLKHNFSTRFQKLRLLRYTPEVIEALDKLTSKEDISNIYVPVSICTSESIIQKFNKYCEQNFVQLNFILDWEKISSRKVYSKQYGQATVLGVNTTPLDDPFNASLKRVFDVVFSLFVLIFICSWLFPIVAIGVKLSSPGPVFFKQNRSGLGSKSFSCLKFRSMRFNKEADKKQATKNDPRITAFGAFLRRSSIDELPQFINVLKGEMSIVGPRPHMLKHTKDYSSLLGNFMARHAIKPGITGLAQVKGFRGRISDFSMLQNRVRYDRFYVNNWSLYFDLSIIAKTILSVFKDHR